MRPSYQSSRRILADLDLRTGPTALRSRTFQHLRYYTVVPARHQKAAAAPLVKSTRSSSSDKNDTNHLQPGENKSTSQALSTASPSAPRINPPTTARPPPLNLPERSPEDPFYKYAFRLGKAYLNFYKTGLKGIWANYKTVRALPGLQGQGQGQKQHPLFSRRRGLYAAASAGQLSRAELQLVLRTRADIKVLPFFGLVFIICGEFTPLIVPYLTAVVPPTLHLPSQTQSISEKREARRQRARAESDTENPQWRQIRSIWDLHPTKYEDALVPATCTRMALELGVYPAWWDKLRPRKLGLMAIQARLGKRLSELKYDDILLLREGAAGGAGRGGVERLERDEVMLALERRGIRAGAAEMSETNARKALTQWLRDRNTAEAKKLIDWLIGAPVDWLYTGTGQKGQQTDMKEKGTTS